ncbi:TonB-dependent receptor [Dyella sp.]|uniref:TonB-dependent receptor family protein n=1 Tax=Dyella sp. TaxID=1869338 RepID=UPI002ED46F13
MGLRLACFAALAAASAASRADDAPPVPSSIALPAVQVNAVRVGVPAFDVPASISQVDVAPGQAGKPGVNLSETLVGVPGVLARDRQNYAQDEQISIRGFGSRSTFGVRGVRVYSDGIPGTMPDGQGQVSHFSLDAADRVDVLRGPFSALYGNSSGGVVQLWSADGTVPAQTRLGLFGGSNGTYRAGASTRGVDGAMNYNIAVSHFQTEGYRDHSKAERESGNAKLGFDLGQGRKLTLVLNTVSLPSAEDPLGLTRAQFQADPRQATASAFQYDTRKSVHQMQGGLIYEQPLGANDQLRLMGYYGSRDVQQVLSIPPSAQVNPLSAGGVVDLAGHYGGVDTRWTHHGELAGRPLELVVGMNYDAQDQHRQGFNDFVGNTLGVTGALRRDEDDNVWNFDQYAQLYWHFAERWSALLGVRHSVVHFISRDAYVTATNPDDSGGARYTATTPVAGLEYRPDDSLRVYASYGRGFETPTFNELGYRADGGAGLAFGLRPSRSRNRELGMKWQATQRLGLEAAIFRADSHDELAVVRNVGGRSSYQNIGRSRRQGEELSLHGDLGAGWRMRLGFTHVQATFGSPFMTCVSSGCTVPDTPVRAGARIPGVPENYGSLRIERGGDLGWRYGVEATGVGAVTVDDINSGRAPGYALLAADAGYGMPLGQTARLHLSARVDNLLDHRYVGSVIVNESNGRFYEPGPSRGFMLGAQLVF